MQRTAIVHVVDNEDAIRDSLAFLLGAEGFQVHTYDSASAFLATVSPEVRGCIVADIVMPDMSGIEMIRRLRAMGIAVPVIAVTGHAEASLLEEAVRSGAFGAVMKPFEDDTLISAIRSALRA